jgi:hypothetical protein
MKMLEEALMELREAIKQFRAIVLPHLVRKQECREFVEIVMVLLVGSLWGLYNPHRIAQEVGCAPGMFYRALHSLSAIQWRGLLERIMGERALECLQHFELRSEATRSRLQASLAIDDSVVRRLGEALSYVWRWYSGQFKQVVRGQELVGIVLRIGNEAIPLALVWVSKQGSGPTSKPAVLLKEISRLKDYFAAHGIDLTQVGISLDSWWVSQPLIEGLAELGFDKQVLAAKANLQLRNARGAANLGQRKSSAALRPGWGHTRPAERLCGANPTLGRIVVILFDHPRSKTFGVICPVRPLRTCEALRLWVNHSAVETFWKRLKHWLGLGRMQLRKRCGSWAELCLRVLAYFFSGLLGAPQNISLAQLTRALRRRATFAELIDEHFHLDFGGNAATMRI